MAYIELNTAIKAPIQRVFDLSRSIDFHQISTPGTKESAIAGRMEGLIQKGETVTWRARHLGFVQKLTTIIPEMEVPHYFCDEMQKGAFRSMRHEHHYEEVNGVTTMTDRMTFISPLGCLGKLFNSLYLHAYMRRFLEKRALILKEWAESDRWREVPGILS
ncbi:MAG TPA: cell division protein [Bacteroidetes bacterium]|nr:cell division protein [Bacteroidota bacterium]